MFRGQGHLRMIPRVWGHQGTVGVGHQGRGWGQQGRGWGQQGRGWVIKVRSRVISKSERHLV